MGVAVWKTTMTTERSRIMQRQWTYTV